MRRPRIDGSTVAIALAAIALFVSLGGPAWAKRVLVGTRDIRDNAITSRKIATGAVHNSDLGAKSVSVTKLRAGAVTNTKLGAAAVTSTKLATASVTNAKLAAGSVSAGKLGDGSVSTGKLADASVTNGKLGPDAVTGEKVKDATLTASDVAPNTFLAANGTAQSADALGGFPAAQYLRGSSARVVVPPDGSGTIAIFPLGSIVGTCTGDNPEMTYENASSPVDVVYSAIHQSAPGALTTVGTKSGLGPNGTVPVTNSATGDRGIDVTFHIGALSPPSRVTTAWIAAQDVAVTGCVFIVSQTSTG